jgi:cytochrome c peroxidase
LWVLASYAAIEEMGGPKIAFTPGRVDAKNDKDCPPNGRLPDAS